MVDPSNPKPATQPTPPSGSEPPESSPAAVTVAEASSPAVASGPAVAPGPAVATAAGPPSHPPQPFLGVRWPGPGRVAAPVVLGVSVAAGVVAAATLPWDRPGIGWLVTGTVVAAGTAAARAAAGTQAGPPAARLVSGAWALCALALLGVGAVRGAGWLFVFCVLGAYVAGSLAVSGGRSAQGLLLGTLSVPIAAIRALPWASRGVSEVRGRPGGSAIRTAAAAAVGLALLVVFGSLLAGADAAFANLLDRALPTVDGARVFRWIFFFSVVGLGTLGGCFLALATPEFDGEPSTRRPLRRVEWALPTGLLVGLFAAFVAVQLTVLFGGGDHVLRTAGLTYAEYARSGFWQLVAVTGLTLAVLAVAARKASRETTADRVWIRAVLGALAVLTLVIVASALSRMWAYEQAYGFTRLRVLVSACELWLGVVFLLVLVAGIGFRPAGRAAWLPGAVLGTGLAALVALGAVNPDRFIADQNVTRYQQTGRIDVDYLRDLSPDAVPALNRLPEPLRTCALVGIADDLAESGPDAWNEWNLGRSQARRELTGYTGPTLEQVLACRQITSAAVR